MQRIMAIEVFKELGEEVRTMRSEEEDVINKTQPEARLLEKSCSRMSMSRLVLEEITGVPIAVLLTWK